MRICTLKLSPISKFGIAAHMLLLTAHILPLIAFVLTSLYIIGMETNLYNLYQIWKWKWIGDETFNL